MRTIDLWSGNLCIVAVLLIGGLAPASGAWAQNTGTSNSALSSGGASATGGTSNSSSGVSNSATGQWSLHERITPQGTYIYGNGDGTLSDSALGAFSSGGGSASTSVGSGASTSGTSGNSGPPAGTNAPGPGRSRLRRVSTWSSWKGSGPAGLSSCPGSTALWVQSDLEEAERRGIARDGSTEAAKNFWREWGAQEFDFLERERPWERAMVIVNGTPTQSYDQSTEIVVAPALH